MKITVIYDNPNESVNISTMFLLQCINTETSADVQKFCINKNNSESCHYDYTLTKDILKSFLQCDLLVFATSDLNTRTVLKKFRKYSEHLYKLFLPHTKHLNMEEKSAVIISDSSKSRFISNSRCIGRILKKLRFKECFNYRCEGAESEENSLNLRTIAKKIASIYKNSEEFVISQSENITRFPYSETVMRNKEKDSVWIQEAKIIPFEKRINI